jgi:hypothetical protein
MVEVSRKIVIQSFWQHDVANVSKFLCDCLVVMLGADSDNESDMISPRWLGRGVID